MAPPLPPGAQRLALPQILKVENGGRRARAVARHGRLAPVGVEDAQEEIARLGRARAFQRRHARRLPSPTTTPTRPRAPPPPRPRPRVPASQYRPRPHRNAYHTRAARTPPRPRRPPTPSPRTRC